MRRRITTGYDTTTCPCSYECYRSPYGVCRRGLVRFKFGWGCSSHVLGEYARITKQPQPQHEIKTRWHPRNASGWLQLHGPVFERYEGLLRSIGHSQWRGIAFHCERACRRPHRLSPCQATLYHLGAEKLTRHRLILTTAAGVGTSQ